MRLTGTQVLARRLHRHGLADRPVADDVAGVAAAICGVHAQVMSAAELSIGLRLPGCTRQTVRTALWDDRSLVKTYGPRGTVHLLPSTELAAWNAGLAAVDDALPPRSDSVLSPSQTDDVVAAIGVALTDKVLTTDELDEALRRGAGAWAVDPVLPAFGGTWPRWRQALATAAHRGTLCYGPPRGRRTTYASPSTWLPDVSPSAHLRVDDALGWLVRSYLHAYGPSGEAGLAQWLAAPTPWVSDLLTSLGDAVVPVTVDGVSAWAVAGDDEVPASPPEGTRLLPYFDAYVVGSHPRSQVYPGVVGERAMHHGQAGTMAVVLEAGVVGGVWHQRRAGRRLGVTVELIGRSTVRRRRAVEEQIERVGEVLEAVPDLTFGAVRSGHHA